MNIKKIIIVIFLIATTSFFCTLIQQDHLNMVFPKHLVVLAKLFNDASTFFVAKIGDFIKLMYSFYLNIETLSLENEVLKQKILSLESRNYALEQEVLEMKKRELLAKIELEGFKRCDNLNSFLNFNTIAGITSILYNIYYVYKIRSSGEGFGVLDRNLLSKIYNELFKVSLPEKDDIEPDLS